MLKISLIPIVFSALLACSQSNEQISTIPHSEKNLDSLQTAYFAAGCFWCVEAIFESIDGVEEVISGYSGGTEKNPTYEMVSSERTQHAETVKIVYDSTIITYDTLLIAFFGSHNPSTLNQQGPDIGMQYRSMIFYQNESEKKRAEKYILQLLTTNQFSKITTEIVPLATFYQAEIYHQNYEKINPENPYVQKVSLPRLNAFKSKFAFLLKK